MKITRLILSNYQQFDFLDMKFTYPENHTRTGQPLDKICLIGKNGTGKTTILNLLNTFFQNPFHGLVLNNVTGIGAVELQYNDQKFFCVNYLGAKSWIKSEKFTEEVMRFFFNKNSVEEDNKKQNFLNKNNLHDNYKNWINFSTPLKKFNNELNNLLIYSPSESRDNKMIYAGATPATNLSNALTFFKKFPYYHEISFNYLEKFWDMIIYQVKKRENDRNEFETKEENINKTKKELIEEFERNNPDFLKVLSEKWDLILNEAGLYFDYENAKRPIQLNDNLEAFIKVKATNQVLLYQQLSSGIQHLIFRLGYLTSLYYKREIKSGVALFDEPENSLYPNLLYKIISIYTEITKNTQFFFATHSPIIAAQFEPYERFILDFDEKHNVVLLNGVAPAGDDPNDLLSDDFRVKDLMGKEGLKNWERFSELKIMINHEKNLAAKEKLIHEYMTIGNKYKF